MQRKYQKLQNCQNSQMPACWCTIALPGDNLKNCFEVFICLCITWFLKVAVFNNCKFTLGTLCKRWYVSKLPGDKLENCFESFEIFVHSKHVCWSCKRWDALIRRGSSHHTLESAYLLNFTTNLFFIKSTIITKEPFPLMIQHHPHIRRQSDQCPILAGTSERRQQWKHPSHPSSKGGVRVKRMQLV